MSSCDYLHSPVGFLCALAGVTVASLVLALVIVVHRFFALPLVRRVEKYQERSQSAAPPPPEPTVPKDKNIEKKEPAGKETVEKEATYDDVNVVSNTEDAKWKMTSQKKNIAQGSSVAVS
uniref:Uncharacterized protein n=1 Tax=Steinernema glaseri TaxID=37863 RepID=A0A1I8AAM5_9BILA